MNDVRSMGRMEDEGTGSLFSTLERRRIPIHELEQGPWTKTGEKDSRRRLLLGRNCVVVIKENFSYDNLTFIID